MEKFNSRLFVQYFLQFHPYKNQENLSFSDALINVEYILDPNKKNRISTHKLQFYNLLAKRPGVAREIFFNLEKNKFQIFLAYNTHECPQKISAQSVRPFGRLYALHNIYTECLV